MPLLSVSPEKTIEFPVQLYSTVTASLRLENASNAIVAYKIKTTAPKNYLVRPSSGVLKEKGTQEIQIILQPLTADPPPSTDRFLVQATRVESDMPLSRDDWTHVAKENIEDYRLDVVFRKEGGAGAGASESYSENAAVYGGPGASEASVASAQGVGGDSRSLKVRYDELVQTVAKLEQERDSLSEQLKTLSSNKPKKGWELWQVVFLVIVVLALAKLASWF
ncbi:unnamed protein product [Vitrella brassicaformis CCMP3155]|uniref:MSP domain-containing protein n=2 Tax=Vitrella brassicaformis TaxID=1169539 RepID=A0A0G4FRL9_VITBC|nr:unnamed protein product [Vitrella brassicaformis CCMP3155]|eukprot:CEM17310.1 unnamed protein product [Vitrella brassicaformis CCMP3155]